MRVAHAPGGAHLLEGRFAQDPATIKNEPHQVWRLPLVVESIGGGGGRTVLLRGSEALSLDPPVLVNAGQLGYARVLYDNDSFAALESAFGKLAPVDQLGLLNDAVALGTAGYAPVARMVSLPAALPAGANPIVWRRAITLLTETEAHYADTPERAAFRAFALRLLAPLATRLGDTATAGESANVTILRASLLEAQSACGDPAVIARARKNLASDTGTAAELRTALTIVAAHADAATFSSLVERARQIIDPLQKQHVYAALAGVTDPELARSMVDIALSDEIPAGGSPEVIAALAARHPQLVWEMVAPRLGDPTLHLDKSDRWRLAVSIAESSADPRRIADLEAYEARSVPVEARRPFLAAAASIRQNALDVTQVLPALDAWIRTH